MNLIIELFETTFFNDPSKNHDEYNKQCRQALRILKADPVGKIKEALKDLKEYEEESDQTKYPTYEECIGEEGKKIIEQLLSEMET